MNHIYLVSMLLMAVVHMCYGAQVPVKEEATTSPVAPQPPTSAVSTESAPNPLQPPVTVQPASDNANVKPFKPQPTATPTSQSGTNIPGVVSPAHPTPVVAPSPAEKPVTVPTPNVETYTPFTPTKLAPVQPVPTNLAAPQPAPEQAPTSVVSEQQQPEQKPEKKAAKPAKPAQPKIKAPPALPSSPVQSISEETTNAPEQAVQAPIEGTFGVDTIDITSGGNWLKKRIIWEEAEREYEKVKNILSAIFESRMEFFTQRASLDKELNYFFIDIGFAQGELEETVQALLDLVESDRTQLGSLSPQERDIREQLLNKKNEIEQLRADAKSIAELDSALDEALTQLLKQISLAANYEKQAWMKFKAIGQELDDKKARDDYAHIETAFKNIQAIQGYISSDLLEYSNSVSSKIHEYMNSIKSQLESIKTSGIELKEKLSELEAAGKKQVEQPEEQPKKKPISWYGSLWNIISYPFVQIKNFFFWVFSKVLGR